jgi:hypothetical protein
MLVFPSRQIVRQTTVCRESNRCRLLTTTSINEGSRTPFVLPLESNQNKPLTEKQPITHVWQKWRCSTPLDIYCGIQHLFSASAFVVIIATFAKRGNVICNAKTANRLKTFLHFGKCSGVSLAIHQYPH